MPNHVYHALKVTGSKKVIDKMQKEMSVKADESFGIDHNKLIPYPKEFAEADAAYKLGLRDKDGYNNGGYRWCLDNWGTKWGFYEFNEWRRDDSLNVAYINFSSAWSIGEEIYLALSRKYPTLRFETIIEEESDAFSGTMIFQAGEIIEDNVKANEEF